MEKHAGHLQLPLYRMVLLLARLYAGVVVVRQMAMAYVLCNLRTKSPAYDIPLSLASPQAWAAMFGLSGILAAIALLYNRLWALQAALVISLILLAGWIMGLGHAYFIDHTVGGIGMVMGAALFTKDIIALVLLNLLAKGLPTDEMRFPDAAADP